MTLDGVEEVREAREVVGAQPDPPRRQHEPGIGRRKAGPAHGNADRLSLTQREVEPILTPKPLMIRQLEALSAPRMERMRDANPLTRFRVDGCSPSSR